MTLSKAVLEAEFSAMMDPNDPNFIGFPVILVGGSVDVPASRAATAANWATAYDRYVNGTSAFGTSQAEDLSTDTVATTNKAGFQSVLTFGTSTAAALAAELGAAWAAFWTAAAFNVGALVAGTGVPCANIPLVVFATEATSVVTVVNSVPIIAALTTELGILSTDGAQKASDIAQIFQDATVQDISVLISGADAVPNPVTNLCTVF